MISAQKPVALENGVALVTGANRGIGLALVKELLARGVGRVYAACRSTEQFRGLDLDRVEILPLNLDNADSIRALAADIGALDVLVNNAGVFKPGGVLSADAAENLHDMLQVHLFGMLALTRALLTPLQASPAAAVVNIASVSGLVNVPEAGAYSVSKACVHSATQSMRGELRESNIRVTGVYPGPTATDMTAGSPMEMASAASVAEQIVSGVAAGAEDIFPDTMSAQAGEVFLAGPKRLEQMLAGMELD